MGTGAVYVTLSGLPQQSKPLSTLDTSSRKTAIDLHRFPLAVIVQTIFYFLNMAIFLLNSSALAIQAMGTLTLVRRLH